MQSFNEYFENLIADPNVFTSKLLMTLALIVSLWIIDRLANKYLDTQIESSSRSILGHHLLRLAYTVILLLGLAIIWFASYDGIGILFLIFFGFIALGIKDIAMDIIAFIYILIRRPFTIKSYIKVEEHMGQIVDIDFLQFHMEEYGANLSIVTPTGKFITYPNRIIFQKSVINYSHDHDMLKMEESILIAFDQDTDRAVEIVQAIAQEAFERTFQHIDEEQIFFFRRYLKEHGGSLEPFVWVDREDIGYRVHVIYSTPITMIALNKRFIQVSMQKELSQAGIKLIIPQAIKVMSS